MLRPNVLANGDADSFPVNIERLDGLGRLEVALLIENIVGGQKRFVSFTDRLAPLEQRGGVAKRFAASVISIDESDQQRCVFNARVQFVQYREVLRNKP